MHWRGRGGLLKKILLVPHPNTAGLLCKIDQNHDPKIKFWNLGPFLKVRRVHTYEEEGMLLLYKVMRQSFCSIDSPFSAAVNWMDGGGGGMTGAGRSV